MREAWAIDNEHGSWLLRLGDRVTFLDDVDRLGRRNALIGLIRDPPRLDRNRADLTRQGVVEPPRGKRPQVLPGAGTKHHLGYAKATLATAACRLTCSLLSPCVGGLEQPHAAGGLLPASGGRDGPSQAGALQLRGLDLQAGAR